MYRIIDTRGTGKTSRLMLIAKETGASFVCQNPDSMRQKAYSYGITGIDFISYKDLLEFPYEDKLVVIDELDYFVKQAIGAKLIGYSISKD